MELLLIIIGGGLCAAIIFTIVDRIRGEAPDDDDYPLPPELEDRTLDEPKRD